MSLPVSEKELKLLKLNQFLPILKEIAHNHVEESPKIKELIDIISNFGAQLNPENLYGCIIACQKLCSKYGKEAEIDKPNVADSLKLDNLGDFVPINYCNRKAGTTNNEELAFKSSSQEDDKPFSEFRSRHDFDFWTHAAQSNQSTNSADAKSFSFAHLNPASMVLADIKREPLHHSLLGLPLSSTGHQSSNYSTGHSRPSQNQLDLPTGCFTPSQFLPPPPRGLSWCKHGAHSSGGDSFTRLKNLRNLHRCQPLKEEVPFPSSSSNSADTTSKFLKSRNTFQSQPPRLIRVPTIPQKIPAASFTGSGSRFLGPQSKPYFSFRNSAYLVPALKDTAQKSSSNYQCFNPPFLSSDAVNGASSSSSIPLLPPKKSEPTNKKTGAHFPCSNLRKPQNSQPHCSNLRRPQNSQPHCSITQFSPDWSHNHRSPREPVGKYISSINTFCSSNNRNEMQIDGGAPPSHRRSPSFVMNFVVSSPAPSAFGRIEPSSSIIQNGSFPTVKKTDAGASLPMTNESEEVSDLESVPFKVKSVRKKLDVSTPVFVPLGRSHPRGFTESLQEDQFVSGGPVNNENLSDKVLPKPNVNPIPTIDSESNLCAPARRRKAVVKKAAVPATTTKPSTSSENHNIKTIRSFQVNHSSGLSSSAANLEPPAKKKRGRPIRCSQVNPTIGMSSSAGPFEPLAKKKRGRPRKDRSVSVGKTVGHQGSASITKSSEKRHPANMTGRPLDQPHVVPKEVAKLYKDFQDYMKNVVVLDGRRRTHAKSYCHDSLDEDVYSSFDTVTSELGNSNLTKPSVCNNETTGESRRAKISDAQIVRTENPSTTSAFIQTELGETTVGKTIHPIPNQETRDQVIDLFGSQLYICGNIACDERAETARALEDHLLVCDLARDSPVLSCKHCGSNWKQVAGLMSHLKQHGVRRYSCGLCGVYRSVHDRRIRNHLKEDHGVTGKIQEVLIGRGPGPDYPGNNMYALRPRDK